MTNRDRGVIKWTSMMLPEHVEKLKELPKQHKKKDPPEIDGQVLEEWSRMLAEAYHEEIPLLIQTIKSGKEESFCGYVRRLDQLQRHLQIDCFSTFEKINIPFCEIVGIDFQ